ncbi:hypothetical protein KKA14_22165 [bacterium]|nr:hypothetical protein [bacterium]
MSEEIEHFVIPRESRDLINLIDYLLVVKDSRLCGNDEEFKDFAEKYKNFNTTKIVFKTVLFNPL